MGDTETRTTRDNIGLLEELVTQPVLAQQDSDGNRWYVHPVTGEKVPSVTTIIKNGIPKPKLVGWAAKMAAEHACANWLRLSKMPHDDRITEIRHAHILYKDKKAEIGDIVHKLIECWTTGEPFPEYPKEIERYADNFINFMVAKRPLFVESEVTLFSRCHGYAGSADFIARIGKKLVLGDVKTGFRLYPEVGLQTSALANADFILREDGTEDVLPVIDELVALHVRPRSWKLVVLGEVDACFRGFLAAKQVMEWERDTAGKVLG